MLLTTTNTIENKKIVDYVGLVTGEAIIGANLFRDIFAGIRDIVSGRSGSYEEVLREAPELFKYYLPLNYCAFGIDNPVKIYPFNSFRAVNSIFFNINVFIK